MPVVQSLITVVVFIGLLGAIVVVHELGHFLLARLFRIRVHEFGIGMPPRAAVLHRGSETLWTLNWLPLGGYVRLEGEDGDSDDVRSFTRSPLPAKILVLAAGVVSNLLLALVLLAAISWLPQTSYGIGFSAVQDGSPAASAGLAPGDLIVGLDGRSYDQFEAQTLIENLRGSAGKTVELGVVRAGASSASSVAVTLRAPGQIDKDHGALGIEQLRYEPSTLGFTRSPGEALAVGWTRTVDALLVVVRGLGQVGDAIVSHPTEAPPAAGPIGIATMVGDVFWQAGILATVYLAAVLSANVALMNVLPFPPLDGGRMFVTLVKSLAGSRLSVRAERLTYLVGFAVLIGFLAWITYFDLARLFGVAQ